MASLDPHLPSHFDDADPVALGRRHAAEDSHRNANKPTPLIHRRFSILKLIAYSFAGLLALSIVVGAYETWSLRSAVAKSLPQLDGSLTLSGLSAPVTVLRDQHGIPHLRAQSMDDLVLAQGYITAQDRLWQMETLRRHTAGTLAEIIGSQLIPHDRAQRLLQIRNAADHAFAVLPPDQVHWLELYAKGVNASIEAQRNHLPVEFHLLGFAPEPWTPRDSVLVGLAMFQDLTTSFPGKLQREAVQAKLTPELAADLYPVGSWRDHPPVQPVVDLTTPKESIEEIPLDESQTLLHHPANPALATPQHTESLLEANAMLAQLSSRYGCESCTAGSNNWVVSGAHTATGQPLLSNDMHLMHGVPGTWYEADLEAPTPGGSFHVEGVSLPGTPFIIVGHNDHVAWGFTNLGADVQDLTIEHTRGTGDNAQFQATDGSWQPIVHQKEIIRVHHGRSIALDVPETRHGNTLTPIISGIYPKETRAISLRWTIYDPTTVTLPFYTVNSAASGAALTAAFATFGGPAQNLVYADDQGHIGYHAVGRIPLRGDPAHPTPPSPVPADASVIANEWSATAPYIPYDQLPQVYDPPGGILATANARVVPDDYLYPITLNWAAPYRNERIWKLLTANPRLTAADMLAIQTDIYSDVDHVIAQRLAYALDHASLPSGSKQKRLHQAADLLRNWNGKVDADASAPAIVDATRDALWQLILQSRLGDTAKLYNWGEKSFAEEQIIMHTPTRWLPSHYANWDDLLAEAVDQGLHEDHAPSDLSTWRYGKVHPVDIEHPVLGTVPFMDRVLGHRTGTGEHPQSGDGTTIKQVGRAFGPSERFTADLADLDHSTLNIVLGQSGNPASQWFLDQWPLWYSGQTFAPPYTDPAVHAATTHTLTLNPQ